MEPNWSTRSLDVRHWESQRWWVQAQSTGLLACTGEAASRKVGRLTYPEAVSSGGTSTHGCMVAASTSPMEHVGTAQRLSAMERNQARSLTKSAGLTWERTSLNVVSHYSCTLACRSSFCLSQLFLPLSGIGLNPANLPGNQLVFPCILLTLFVEWLPLKLGLCLSDHLQLPESHAEVESFICLWALGLVSVERCSGGCE